MQLGIKREWKGKKKSLPNGRLFCFGNWWDFRSRKICYGGIVTRPRSVKKMRACMHMGADMSRAKDNFRHAQK